MKVKICGIMSASAADAAAKGGADAVGFVFAKSKRRISLETCCDIVKTLPSGVWKVGVFVDSPPEEVSHIVREAGLTHIQLHGEEKPEDYTDMGADIIKAFSIRCSGDIKQALTAKADYILLDGPPGMFKGGNGRSFDWNLARQIDNRKRLILAGGLNELNVCEAISLSGPGMVDVSSGVETDGQKDLKKIERFIKKAKSCQRGCE